MCNFISINLHVVPTHEGGKPYRIASGYPCPQFFESLRFTQRPKSFLTILSNLYGSQSYTQEYNSFLFVLKFKNLEIDKMVGRIGFEPMTNRLKAECSTS